MGSLPGVKRTEREVNHSSPSTAEIKNVWSHTSASLIWVHDVDRGNFTLLTFSLLRFLGKILQALLISPNLHYLTII